MFPSEQGIAPSGCTFQAIVTVGLRDAGTAISYGTARPLPLCK